jgi:putative NADH-flavin reductase
MQITIFGASGRVGQLIVQRALALNYEVVAVTHSQSPFQEQTHLKTIQGDIKNAAFVAQAMHSSDAVISALGSWGTKTKDIVASGTKNIIMAAENQHLNRVITLTGTAAFASTDQVSSLDKLSHLFLSIVAPKILKDGEAHLGMLEASNLDWTCIRSPAMSSTNYDGYVLKTRLASLLARIPRQAVAKAMIDQLTATDQYRKAPVIYQK